MAFGTLYIHSPNPRSLAILTVAKSYGLELDVVHAEKTNAEGYERLLKVNPLGQVPTFVGSDGYVLTESIAIALYIASKSDTSALLGITRRDYYDILRWMSFANGDLLPAIGGCLLPLIGRRQIIRQNIDDSVRAMRARCGQMEEHLKGKLFLVSDQLTLADLFMVGMLAGAYMAWNTAMETEYPEVSRWFYMVYGLPMVKDIGGKLAQYHLPFPVVNEPEGENDSH